MTVPQRRSTTQRTAIIEALAGSPEFRSAQDLHAALRADGSSVGLATVYRALQSMVTDGELDTVRTATGEVLYRQCERTGHHHHLVCRSCGSTQELAAPMVEKWAAGVAQEYGYTDIDHQVELFGLCADCSARTS